MSLPAAAIPTADHVREHRSILVLAERRLLDWLAARMPLRINSDHLTLLGMVGMLLAGLGFWASRWDERALWVVVIALAVNWFGDSLDGTLARFRNCQRPRYGFYVDHVVDIVGAAFLMCGLALSGYVTPLLGLGLLTGFLMVSAESYLATHALGVFRLSFMRVGPTELRILLMAGTLKVMVAPSVAVPGLGVHLLFDVGAVCGLVAMAVVLVASACRNTRALYRAEPLPPSGIRGER
jgi:phosphatidylglycerophosphate synthase